jgi:hypothetical protein
VPIAHESSTTSVSRLLLDCSRQFTPRGAHHPSLEVELSYEPSGSHKAVTALSGCVRRRSHDAGSTKSGREQNAKSIIEARVAAWRSSTATTKEFGWTSISPGTASTRTSHPERTPTSHLCRTTATAVSDVRENPLGARRLAARRLRRRLPTTMAGMTCSAASGDTISCFITTGDGVQRCHAWAWCLQASRFAGSQLYEATDRAATSICFVCNYISSIR